MRGRDKIVAGSSARPPAIRACEVSADKEYAYASPEEPGIHNFISGAPPTSAATPKNQNFRMERGHPPLDLLADPIYNQAIIHPRDR